MKLAIIGAGMAGLTTAHRLQHEQPHIEPIIYEKSRGVGGRAATRRAHGAVFDHGAQYVKAPTRELQRLLTATLAHDTLVNIDAPVWTFDCQGKIEEGDPAQNRDPKWTYSDGLNRLAKELARDLDIRLQKCIGHVAQAERSFILFDTEGNGLGATDAVLFTPPAPQTADIIRASAIPPAAQTAILAQLEGVSYRPCLTVTLGYDPVLQSRPWYALVNMDKQHPISWLAYEHRKAGRMTNRQHILITQMAPQWSREHWQDDLSSLTAQVTTLLSELLQEDLRSPRWSDRHGWRYALPDGRADFDDLNTALQGFFFAGDYTAGQGRVHLAMEQGWQVANCITALATTTTLPNP